ncbi:hypothetical protein BHM03_00027359 [Ensete ventricosum]|nr:hypothetical protein BHM03_00027359 [Ensete ventricosum]
MRQRSRIDRLSGAKLVCGLTRCCDWRIFRAPHHASIRCRVTSVDTVVPPRPVAAVGPEGRGWVSHAVRSHWPLLVRPHPDRPVLLTATGDVSTRLEARDTVAARVCTVTRRHRVVYHYYYYYYPSRVSRSSVVAYVADIIHMQGFTISSTEMETDGG